MPLQDNMQGVSPGWLLRGLSPRVALWSLHPLQVLPIPTCIVLLFAGEASRGPSRRLAGHEHLLDLLLPLHPNDPVSPAVENLVFKNQVRALSVTGRAPVTSALFQSKGNMRPGALSSRPRSPSQTLMSSTTSTTQLGAASLTHQRSSCPGLYRNGVSRTMRSATVSSMWKQRRLSSIHLLIVASGQGLDLQHFDMKPGQPEGRCSATALSFLSRARLRQRCSSRSAAGWRRGTRVPTRGSSRMDRS